MAKPVTAWCVANRRGDLITSTIARTRIGSIKQMVGPEDGWRKRWRSWRDAYGCRCVRVTVALATPASGGPRDG